MDGYNCIRRDKMSLAFTLDVSELQNIDGLSQALISLGTADPFTDIFRSRGRDRFLNNTGFAQDTFPTGEYIIRDGMYINGMFVYVGSYKGYFVDLFGSGSNGYAWDGFIMVFRGYSLNDPQNPLLVNDPNTNLKIGGTGFGFLPMRMPFEVNPGASGSATAIAADSAVGLHSLEVYKNFDDVLVSGGDKDIRIITCGFQRINPSVEGVPTGMDYVGNLYMGGFIALQW